MGYRNEIFGTQQFWGLLVPLRSLICGVYYPKRHIYDLSGSNPVTLCANLMFCEAVAESQTTTPKCQKSHFFNPILYM